MLVKQNEMRMRTALMLNAPYRHQMLKICEILQKVERLIWKLMNQSCHKGWMLTASARLHLVVFGHVAPRLTVQPDGGVIGRLTARGAQVFEMRAITRRRGPQHTHGQSAQGAEFVLVTGQGHGGVHARCRSRKRSPG